MMSRVILVPFDGSAPSRVAVERALALAHRDQCGILLAVPSMSNDGAVQARSEVQHLAGQDLRVEMAWIGMAGAGERFTELAETLQPALVVVPLNAHAGSRALQEIARTALRHPSGCTVAVDVGHVTARSDQERAQGGIGINERRGVDSADAGLLRGIARLCLGLRAAVRGGTR